MIERVSPITYTRLIGYSSVVLVLLVAFGLWARDSMSRTRLNRAVLGVAALTPAVQILLSVGNRALGLSPELTMTQFQLMWTILAVSIGLAVERWLIVSGAVFAVCWLISAHAPHLSRPLMSVGNLALTVVLLIAWRPRDRSWDAELRQR
jgi:hypothetical protein